MNLSCHYVFQTSSVNEYRLCAKYPAIYSALKGIPDDDNNEKSVLKPTVQNMPTQELKQVGIHEEEVISKKVHSKNTWPPMMTSPYRIPASQKRKQSPPPLQIVKILHTESSSHEVLNTQCTKGSPLRMCSNPIYVDLCQSTQRFDSESKWSSILESHENPIQQATPPAEIPASDDSHIPVIIHQVQ